MGKYEEEAIFTGKLLTETCRHQCNHSGLRYHYKDFSNLTASSIMKRNKKKNPVKGKKGTEELDVYFVNGTDKEKRTVTVSKAKTVNLKVVFVEITNEKQGKVTFQ